jgi:hypothetical protein
VTRTFLLLRGSDTRIEKAAKWGASISIHFTIYYRNDQTRKCEMGRGTEE